MQPEARVTRMIREWLSDEGHFAFKVHGGPMMMAGLPDLVAVVHGRFLGVETKMPGNHASLKQKYVHSLIRRAGGVVVIAYTLNDVRSAVQELEASLHTMTRATYEKAVQTHSGLAMRQDINTAIEQWVSDQPRTPDALYDPNAVKEMSRYVRTYLHKLGYVKFPDLSTLGTHTARATD